MTRFLVVGTCTVCGTGSVGVRIPAEGGPAVGMCDECDAVWTDPGMTDGPHFPQAPGWDSPAGGGGLGGPMAHWATHEEADRVGWSHAVIREGTPLGHS